MSEPLDIKFVRVSASAILPTVGSAGAACFDIYASEPHTVAPGRPADIETGLRVEIPPGHAMLIYSRSGHGFRNGVRLSNCVGVIDSDYRGELRVKLTADEKFSLVVKRGDRIAQFMVVPVPSLRVIEVQELSATERGAGGFGSTGA